MRSKDLLEIVQSWSLSFRGAIIRTGKHNLHLISVLPTPALATRAGCVGVTRSRESLVRHRRHDGVERLVMALDGYANALAASRQWREEFDIPSGNSRP
jgi:hypothetical protein